MHFAQLVFLLGAAFVAGIVNSVAGGGSLISFPALLIVGIAPLVANVTNSVASWPGYLGGALGYRSHLGHQRSRLIRTSIAASIGSLAGTAILLLSPSSVFRAVVPFLVLGSCALLGFQRPISNWVARKGAHETSDAGLLVSVGLAAVYGSYFGAGLGIILLAVFSIFASENIQNNNAAKIALSLVIGTVGALVYIFFAHVAYDAVAVMAGGFLAGGLTGAKVAKRLPAKVLRYSVISFGVVVGAVLLVQNLTQK